MFLARARAVFVGVALLAVACPAWAEAPALANGRAHFLGARFEPAEAAFTSVVENGASSRADLAEAYRYLSAVRLVRGLRADAEAAALRALSLDRGLTPPDGAPAGAADLFDSVRARVPDDGLACILDLPSRPIASAPVGVRILVVGDPAGLVASAALRCGGRVQRVAPEPGADGTALAVTSVDGGPAGRRTECVATLHSAANVELARATGIFVAAQPVADTGEDVLAGAGRGRSHRRERGGRFPWVWVGVGAGVAIVAGAVITAVVLSSDSGDAYVGHVVLTDE